MNSRASTSRLWKGSLSLGCNTGMRVANSVWVGCTELLLRYILTVTVQPTDGSVELFAMLSFSHSSEVAVLSHILFSLL